MFNLLIIIAFLSTLSNAEYFVGTGIHDITGPAVEANFMGYANPAQNGKGIHLRLFSRAFIFSDIQNETRFVFVSVDCGMISQIVKTEVSNQLKQLYGGLYTEQNVALSSTHSHSGPGGFHQYVLFDVTSLGFVKETFLAMTKGIVQSIVKAHNSMTRAHIFVNRGILLDSNINRSPSSYLANPPDERSKFKYDVDKEMTLLRIVSTTGEELGMINWFAVHGTSMNNTNKLVSGDNKGYASQLFERLMNNNSRPGQGKFVAAFAQANLGDVSPNIRGPHCTDTGKPCDILTSTCNGKNEKCIASGPGRDMYESTRIIGDRQFHKARQLYEEAYHEKIIGPIQYKHQFIEMTNVQVRPYRVTVDGNSSWVSGKTCVPAMGYSFAAGTTDGPGAFDFTQGTTKTNAFWNLIRDFLKTPSKELVQCQHPKPILLATGELNYPHQWQAHIVETQILRLGQLAIVAVPGEFTTMSGRRLRNTTAQKFAEQGITNVDVVIAGLSNTYADYIATFEEYQKQRYEAASTIYGPHTLAAYLQQYSNLTEAMLKNETLATGPVPPFNTNIFEYLLPVLYDIPSINRYFGQVLHQPPAVVHQGDVVQVKFVGANPRSHESLGSSNLFVESFNNVTGNWSVAYNDADWETRFEWNRTGRIALIFVESEVTITWSVPLIQQVGLYRIRYVATARHLISHIQSFTGISNTFSVV